MTSETAFFGLAAILHGLAAILLLILLVIEIIQ